MKLAYDAHNPCFLPHQSAFGIARQVSVTCLQIIYVDLTTAASAGMAIDVLQNRLKRLVQVFPRLFHSNNQLKHVSGRSFSGF